MKKLLIVLLLAVACSPKSTSEENTLAQIEDPEVMKYAVDGKTIYENHCGNCHQSDGTGVGNLIPPLRDADYFQANIHRTVWIMKHGQEGDVIVNGQVYNQPMPASPKLTPLEIAQISTYLYNIWGMSEGKITSSQVEKYLQQKPDF
ncbi:mono/diheme cytochrome c family protein [Algoriphagus ratkowskyi]|uniref:Cytochrome c n=1 Tax=Algoriphagus ratkowskyi TaxID=57028 RepID=A0A2W7QQ43_9BACT|nr:cytochrome c [Algoriphagus ratkowskyi]PZX50464.1 mono/diheme cytochrome c family protein [Algoriphagus ratkowskyi]TXD75726.1 cytochrome c [Algoriphagus ratkowskyi]